MIDDSWRPQEAQKEGDQDMHGELMKARMFVGGKNVKERHDVAFVGGAGDRLGQGMKGWMG